MGKEWDLDKTLNELEPGHESSPAEWDWDNIYNPFHHCYQMPCTTKDDQHVTITVKFMLTDYKDLDPLTFTTKDGTTHTIPFFPVYDEVGLPPEISGPEPTKQEMEIGYQAGEPQYQVCPAIIKVECADGSTLCRADAQELITPDDLLNALHGFRDILYKDGAPECLLELVDTLCGDTFHTEDDYTDDLDED